MALFARANANAAFLTNNCYFTKLTTQDSLLRNIVNYANKYSISKKKSKSTYFVSSYVRRNVTTNFQKTFVRQCHVVPHNQNYLPFEELILQRRQQAGRSILVQVQSAKSDQDLLNYCEKFGAICSMHHHAVEKDMQFYLIEFRETSGAEAALAAATHVNYDAIIPVHSPMLWFRNSPNGNGTSGKKFLRQANSTMLMTEHSNVLRNQAIDERLNKAETVSEQMIMLYDAWKLDEVGIRLRFLTAHQLERSFVGLFPRITVLPFGSSVNGFGNRCCDLDLVLSLENNKKEKLSSRFVFHAKTISRDAKAQSKRLMETIADSMQYFIPGVANVRRILQARVPIIKYDQTLTGLECDLSMTNMTAVYMSELLCLYGEIDHRVRPLVFTVRQWAKNVGLTNPSPGRWITNFSITLLVLFYLQQKRILPTVNILKTLAGAADVRVADDFVDCTFLRDVTKFPVEKTNENTDSLETLLRGFFEFYSTFDFPAKAISLRDGASIFKPDFSPLYISNPLQTMLNVSQNVSLEETERLKFALRNASWILESADDCKAHKRGVLAIFNQKLDTPYYVSGKRSVNVAALFKMGTEEGLTSADQSMSNTATKDDVKDFDDEESRITKLKIKKGRARRR